MKTAISLFLILGMSSMSFACGQQNQSSRSSKIKPAVAMIPKPVTPAAPIVATSVNTSSVAH